MRLVGAFIVALVMYIAVPLIWQYEMVAKVKALSNQPPLIPATAAIPSIDTNLTMNAINSQVNIDTKDYQRIAIQSQVDEQMRQVEAAQDRAWQASHPDIR